MSRYATHVPSRRREESPAPGFYGKVVFASSSPSSSPSSSSSSSSRPSRRPSEVSPPSPPRPRRAAERRRGRDRDQEEEEEELELIRREEEEALIQRERLKREREEAGRREQEMLQRVQEERLKAEKRRREEEMRRIAEEEERERRDAELARQIEEASRPFECSICLELKPKDDLFEIEGCNHPFCIVCVRGQVESAVRSMKCQVDCLQHGCTNKLSEVQILCLLDEEGVERFQKNQQRAIMEAIPNYVQCHTPDCLYGIELEGEETFFSCLECAHTRCIKCNVAPHHGITCEQYQQWAKDNKKGDDAMQQMKEAGFFRVCPHCKNGVQKEAGCNRMMCRCGNNFCYVCSVQLDNANPYSHFRSAGATCPLHS